MNLSNYSMHHFVPMDSFNGKDETFIWTEAVYCKENNIIAARGCYWGGPFSTEFYDFTSPEKMPYTKLSDTSDIDDETKADCSMSLEDLRYPGTN